MPKEITAEQQLASFMARFTPEIVFLARAIRSEMRHLYPSALELVYDNYNALAIGYSPTERASEAIFSIALYPRWVSLFFLQGACLPDPCKILRGSGNVAKHIVLPSPDALRTPLVQTLMREATARAKIAFDPSSKHRLIIKSISAKQRPRRPAKKPAAPAKPHMKGKSAKAGPHPS
jgi:hypothetical protein